MSSNSPSTKRVLCLVALWLTFLAASPASAATVSVPLDLPEARDGLPPAVTVVNGAPRFGAAGLGWDVPISYIYRETSIARHRPAQSPGSAVQPRTRLNMVLDGVVVNLVRNLSDSAWVSRHNGPQLEVRDVSTESFEMYDVSLLD